MFQLYNFEDLYVEQKDYDRLTFKIELDDQNYKVETHPMESAANLENKTKYVYDEIKKKYQYIDFLKKDPNQSLSGIWSMKKGDVIFEMKKSDIINLCNSGLNVEEDFEIIVKLLDKGFQSIDYLGEISERKQINKLWKEIYEPWNKIEQDKYNFFETVRKRTREDVKNSIEIRDFLLNIELSAEKTIDRFYEEYSYEARTSSHFDSRFNTNELIKDIKNIYESVLKEDFYVRNEMKFGSIDKRLNPDFGKKDLKEYEYVYDIDTYVKADDFKDSIIFDTNNNKFNQYMIDYQNTLFEKEIKRLKNYYDVYTAGMQGSIIIDKVLDFFWENIPMSKCTGKSNSNLYFLENSNNLAKEMILKYGDNFLSKEKPIYFPTVKNLIEFDVDYLLRKSDKNSFIYQNLMKMQDAGMLDGLNSTKRDLNSKSFLNFDETIDLIKPLESLAAGFALSKSEEVTKISELELKRSQIINKHNGLVNTINTTKEKKEKQLNDYLDLTQTLKKEKIENYTFENIIDEEKFFTVLSTIVDLTKNEENIDKIVDLTKFDKNQTNFNEFLQSLQNSYKEVLFENYFKSFENLRETPISNNQYFPLFIDLVSLTIWTVEWTTKYPMLHITLLPEAYKIIEDSQKTYTLDDLDRIKDIFSLIQTNYFLQMDQPEVNALFLDIDPNFLLNPKVNIGAVPFMTKDDLELLQGVHNDDRVKYNNNLPFIDPYNYSIDGKEETLSAFNIQNRKVEGLHSEQSSKEGMNSFKNNKLKFIEKGKLEIFETRELISKTEALYGYNHFNTNKGKTLDSSIYRIQPEKLKLFKTKDELDSYIKKYNDILERAFI